MGKSNIPYISHVWNVLTGCSGKNCQADCYAKRFVKARPAMHGYYPEGWNADGAITPIPFSEIQFHPDRLSEPLKRKKPTVYGVGFFGDMFDEQVKIEWLRDLHKTMWAADRHQYVLLTKQPQRMASVLSDPWFWPSYYRTDHIWHGTTICTQEEADTRIPEILKVPGRKWLSIEPMLGRIDLTPPAYRGTNLNQDDWLEELDVIILGGESGKNARPLHPDWAREVRDRCLNRTDMGRPWPLPFYFKQHGEWAWMGGQKKKPNTQMRICRGGEVEPSIYTETTLPRDGFLMFGTEYVISKVGTKAAG